MPQDTIKSKPSAPKAKEVSKYVTNGEILNIVGRLTEAVSDLTRSVSALGEKVDGINDKLFELKELSKLEKSELEKLSKSSVIFRYPALFEKLSSRLS